jgi:ketosteroid isomerase-like protein
MRLKIGLIFLLLWLTSCEQFRFRKKDERLEALNAMEQTDADFSAFAVRKGYRAAFLEYLDAGGTLLRPGRLPIIGAAAVDFINNIKDSTLRLSWEPQGGDMAVSGDLGYTYGIYTMNEGNTETQGTYVTIWRKQKDGKWKYVLDSGNPGIGVSRKDTSRAYQ